MKNSVKIWATACVLAWGGPAMAMELALPANAAQTVERNTSPDRYAAPIAVYQDGEVAKLDIEGDVRRAAWRLDTPGLTSLQVMRPLRTQLDDAGFEIVLDCASETCGGFDFRFATETLPGPNMYVNIRAFHFVTAVRPSVDAPQEIVTVLTSTSATSAYIQIIEAGVLGDTPIADAGAASIVTDIPIIPPSPDTADIATRLLSVGHAVLQDLDFDTGTSELGRGPFQSLAALADFLTARPGIRIALVGHTDSVGGLDINIGLSRARAQSVRSRLIGTYGVAAARMEAQGMGYLSPVASNLDPAGRDANRRVEVVLLSED